MAGCTQGNLGLSVTIIGTSDPPINRENAGRSPVILPLVVVLGDGVCGHWGARGAMVRGPGGLGWNCGDHLVVSGKPWCLPVLGFLPYRSSVAGHLERTRCG